MTRKRLPDPPEEFTIDKYYDGSEHIKIRPDTGEICTARSFAPEYSTPEQVIEDVTRLAEGLREARFERFSYKWDDGSYLALSGWRDMTDKEKEMFLPKIEALRQRKLEDEARSERYRREQYERLKKEFGNG